MMLRNSWAVALLLAATLTAAAPAAGALADDGLSQSVIADAHDRITPAMCRLTYSLEITNASTGEVSRRNRYTQGLIVSPDGLIMAHGHMQIEDRRPSNIRAHVGWGDEKKEYGVSMLKKPDDINVVFLRLERENEDETFPYLTFPKSAEFSLAEPIAIFGLLDEPLDYARSFVTRRIGAVLEEPRVTYALDAPISFGFVGGPVINANGELSGVCGFDLSSNEGGELYTRSGHPLVFQPQLFASYIENPPSEEALNLDREDAWLGVFTQPLTDDLAQYWSLPQQGGVVVSTIIPGSPAQQAGLRSGDVIVSFNDTPVTAKRDQDVLGFTKLVRETPLGEAVPLQLYRDGEMTELRLTLRPRPKSVRDANEFEDSLLGWTVRELTTDVRILLNLSDDVEGVIVRRVESGSPAAIAGIRPRFIVLSIGGVPIRGIEDFNAAINAISKEKPREVAVFCRVGAQTGFFRVQPRWDE